MMDPSSIEPKAQHNAPPKRRVRPYLFAAAAPIGIGCLLWVLYTGWLKGDEEADRLLFATVERADIENSVTATGTLQPRDYVDVGTQVSGQLKIVHFKIGQQVKQGDLLAQIDPIVLQARVDAGRAQLQNQNAQLADKRSQLVLAQQQLQRQRNLMREEATTTEALQTAEAEVESLHAQIAAIKAQMKQTESTLRGDEANLGYTKIYAPMSGTVVSQIAKQGQTLNANQQAPIILRIADLSTMTVQTQVSEADVSKLRLGMKAYFTTLGGRDKRWYGDLRQINPTPTVLNNVVLYDSLFDVPNEDGALMTQMTAQVFFLIDEAKDVLVVPTGSLHFGKREAAPSGDKGANANGARRAKREDGSARRGGEATLRVLKDDGSLEERTVKVGVMNRVSAQVVEGVKEGEQVVSGFKQATDVERAPPKDKNRPPTMQPRI